MGSLLIIRVILLFSNIGDALYCWGVECHENQQYQRFVRHKVIRFKSLCITDFGNASYLTLRPGQALQYIITQRLATLLCLGSTTVSFEI